MYTVHYVLSDRPSSYSTRAISGLFVVVSDVNVIFIYYVLMLCNNVDVLLLLVVVE